MGDEQTYLCEKKWASEFMTDQQLNDMFSGRWAAIPTVCHVQPNGTVRRISNCRVPGHTAANDVH